MEQRSKNLYYMNELPDYQIARGYHDVRDWEIKDVHDRTIGKVDNLLVDIQTSRVVYLDVEVDNAIIHEEHDLYTVNSRGDVHEFINTEGQNHLLVPIGQVVLHPDQKYVQTNSVDVRFFANSKRMAKGSPVSRDYELLIVDSYGEETESRTLRPGPLLNGKFYDRKEFDDSGFHKKE
jgi:hypothetical protein